MPFSDFDGLGAAVIALPDETVRRVMESALEVALDLPAGDKPTRCPGRGHILAGERDSFGTQSIFDRRRFGERRQETDETREPVVNHRDDLFTYRKLKRRKPGMPPHMNGAGAIQRNIGTVAGHRMKHRGMGWTRKGAANMMCLRLDMVPPRTS